MYKITRFQSNLEDAQIHGECPHCHKQCEFQSVGSIDILTDHVGDVRYIMGARRCPGCENAVFCLMKISLSANGHQIIELTEVFPKPYPQIEKEVPKLITKFLTEALICFREGCFTASAIMIRRTLEEICKEVGAEGKDLHHKILDLPNKTTIHKKQIDVLMQLKLLGNDAVHVELKHFDQIGEKEVNIGLSLVQEIIRSWFHFLHLEGQLKSLKKTHNA